MGARLIAKGVDAEDYAFEYAAPVRRGFEGMFFLNTSMEKCLRNYAPGKNDATLVGAPVVSASYLSGRSGVNFLQTDIAETAEMTMYTVARALNIPATLPMAAADAVILAGDYSAASPVGVVQWFATPTSFSGGAAFGADPNTTSNVGASVATDPTRWCLYSTVVRSNAVITTNHTTGVTSTRTITTEGVRQVSNRKLRLGSSYQTSQTGTWDMMLHQVHNVAVTDQEKADTVADLKAYILRRTGITV